jgi:RNA polymerase sigma-70 factor, ECF subfamily
VAWSVCRDESRAEEAVQEAFVSIWRSRATYRPQRGAVAAWVLTVARHRAIDIARRHDRYAAQRATAHGLATRSAPDEVAAQAVDRADAGRLQALLARLPDTQQEVIALAFYGQLTHTEIAKQLGLPPGTVKGRMRLGLHKLREGLVGDAPA